MLTNKRHSPVTRASASGRKSNSYSPAVLDHRQKDADKIPAYANFKQNSHKAGGKAKNEGRKESLWPPSSSR